MIKNNILETLMFYVKQPKMNELILNSSDILSPKYIVKLNKFFKIKFIFKNPITRTNFSLKKETQVKELCCSYNSLEEKVLSVLKYTTRNIEVYIDLNNVEEIYIYDCRIITPVVDEVNKRLKYTSSSVLEYLLSSNTDSKIKSIPYAIKKEIKNFLKDKNYQHKIYSFFYNEQKYFIIYNKNRCKYSLILNDKEYIKDVPFRIYKEIRNHFDE